MNRDATSISPHTNSSDDFWERLASSSSGDPVRTVRAWSDDDIIEAWNLGREALHKDTLAIYRKQIDENLASTVGIASNISDALVNKGMRPMRAYLRSSRALDFEMLFVVDEASFVSDEFLLVYELAWRIVQSERSDTFRPSIRFMPISPGSEDQINISALKGDGYILTFSFHTS